jgi:hypothetical protein
MARVGEKMKRWSIWAKWNDDSAWREACRCDRNPEELAQALYAKGYGHVGVCDEDKRALEIAVAELKATLPANVTPDQEAEAVGRFAFDYACKRTFGMTFGAMSATGKKKANLAAMRTSGKVVPFPTPEGR